ncbi:MAG: hypothetical protein ABW200_01645 [Hyphomicrobiaceae bacterium]
MKLDVMRQRICGELCAMAGELINAPAAAPAPSFKTVLRCMIYLTEPTLNSDCFGKT